MFTKLELRLLNFMERIRENCKQEAADTQRRFNMIVRITEVAASEANFMEIRRGEDLLGGPDLDKQF